MTTTKSSKTALWTGWFLSGFCILFLLFDSVTKIMTVEQSVVATVELGYPEHTVFRIGMILLICTALYIIPKTSILGAVLLTAYLGGAVATHVRVENPLFSHTLFPVYVGIMVWAGLYLRHDKLRTLIKGARPGMAVK